MEYNWNRMLPSTNTAGSFDFHLLLRLRNMFTQPSITGRGNPWAVVLSDVNTEFSSASAVRALFFFVLLAALVMTGSPPVAAALLERCDYFASTIAWYRSSCFGHSVEGMRTWKTVVIVANQHVQVL